MLQILDNYTRVHTLSMRVLNVSAALKEAPEALKMVKDNPEMSLFVARIVQPSVESGADTPLAGSIPKRRLRGLRRALKSLSELGEDLGIDGLAASVLDYAKSEGLVGVLKGIIEGCDTILTES